jgi:hypothetical protein
MPSIKKSPAETELSCVLSHKAPIAVYIFQVKVRIRPMIQIESGYFLQGFTSLLENEQSAFRVDPDLIEWNGKIFYADAEKAAELYNDGFQF